MHHKFPTQTTPYIHPTYYTIASNSTQQNEKLHHIFVVDECQK